MPRIAFRYDYRLIPVSSIFFLITIFTLIGCKPRGELTRTLHAPHQHFTDKFQSNTEGLNRANQNTDVSGKTKTLTSSGLPKACQMVSEGPLCLSCSADSLVTYRCYDYHGKWQPEDVCRSSIESVKCLVKDPPFALSLNFKNSEEKYFRENSKIWGETITRIWNEKLSELEKAETLHIIKAVDLVGDLITTQTKLQPTDLIQLADIVEQSNPEAMKEYQDFPEKIYVDRAAGRLKLNYVIRDLEEMWAKTRGTSSLFAKFRALSLEGLED